MAVKRRKKNRKRREPKLRSSTLPSRDFELLEINLASGDPGSAIGFVRTEDFRGKVVKPVVRYLAGDEASLGEVLRMLDSELAGRAKHVMRPKLEVVREASSSEDPATATLSMEAAASEYMRRRPPRKVSKARVLKNLRKVLRGVQVEVPPRPSPFWLRRMWSEDWGPFPGRHEVELDPGVYSIEGRFVGEEGSSNRAGKTRLLSIVPSALVDSTPPKKVKEDLAFGNRLTAKAGVLAELPAGDGLEVERAFGRKAGHRAGDATGKAACDTEVASRLGVTKDDFLNSAYCGQDDLHGIAGQGSATLADDLARWHGLDAWDEAHKASSRLLADCEAKLEAAREKEREANEELKGRKWPSEAGVKAARSRHEKALRADERARNAPDEVRRLEKDLERVLEANRARKKAAALPAMRREVQDLRIEAKELERKLDSARVEVGRLSDEAKRLGQTCEQGFDGTCPVDGGRCTRKNAINENLKEVEAARRRVLAKKKDARLKATEHRTALKTCRKKRASLERKLAEMEAAEKAAAAAKDLPKASEIRKAITRARKATGTTIPDLDAAREEAERRAADRERYLDLRTRRRKARKEAKRQAAKHGALRYLDVLTSREGARSIQLRAAVVELESATNSLLAELGADFRTEVEFERETRNYVDICPHCGSGYEKTGAGDCPGCGERRPKATRYEPSFSVKDASGSHPFDQDSGGGKSLVAIAVRVALARMLGYRVLFLDEVCGKLDDRNLQAFVEMVARLPEVGFAQVFVVSHRPQVAASISRRIVVERDAAAGESRYFLEG